MNRYIQVADDGMSIRSLARDHRGGRWMQVDQDITSSFLPY